MKLKKILNTIISIFSNKKIPNTNAQLTDKIKAIKKILNETADELNLKLYLISNTQKNSSIDSNTKIYLDSFKKDNNLKYEDITIETLFNLFNDVEKKDKNFNTTITSIDGYIDTKITDTSTYIMNIKARELIRIYEECGKERIFVNNVRCYLEKLRINQQIEETIKDKDFPDSSKYFYLFNNGISIIVENIETGLSLTDENGNKKFKITNPFIVNGGQTTKTLYNLYKENEDYLRNVKVLVKFYKTTEQTLIDKIVIGTNTQNAIYIKDLYANNKIQKEIQIFFKDRNIGFEIKRGEFNKNRTIYDNIIANDVFIQAYISIYDSKPHVAKNNKNNLFYKEFKHIFKDENDNLAEKLFRSYELYKFVLTNKNNHYTFIEYSTFHILYCMTLLDNKIVDITNNLNDNKLIELYNKSLEIINAIVVKKASEDKDRYSNTLFFKSLEATNLISEHKINNILTKR